MFEIGSFSDFLSDIRLSPNKNTKRGLCKCVRAQLVLVVALEYIVYMNIGILLLGTMVRVTQVLKSIVAAEIGLCICFLKPSQEEHIYSVRGSVQQYLPHPSN